MIYLDNAATSRKKPLSVKLALLKGVSKYSANPGRSSHKYSINTYLKIEECRDKIKEYFSTTNDYEVIFTQSCTEALNLAILGTAKKNGHIISTYLEHNSTLRPINHLLSTQNISHTLIKPNKNGTISPIDIEKTINKNTYAIILNHTSNVTGNTNNIFEIGKIAKKHNLLFIVDGAQSAGHENITIPNCNITHFAIAGHKGLLGPQGVGALITNTKYSLTPLKFGGTGTSSEKPQQPLTFPEGYESGTLSTPNILALKKGIEYVQKNQVKINNKIYRLTNYLIENLKSIKGVLVYSKLNKCGVVSISFSFIDNNQAINILATKFNIALRGGLHCAPKIHEHLNTLETGLVRISIGAFNKKSEIKKLIKAITYMSDKYYI